MQSLIQKQPIRVNKKNDRFTQHIIDIQFVERSKNGLILLFPNNQKIHALIRHKLRIQQKKLNKQIEVSLFFSKCQQTRNKIIDYKLIIMGCSSMTQQPVSFEKRLNSPTGKLKITITKATIYNKVSCFKMDPYLILRISNQSHTSKVAIKGDKQPSFFQTFQFFINSCHKINGRNLQLTLMDKNKIKSDNQIGFGIIDLDPVINTKKKIDQARCFLGFQREKAALVNVILQFVEEDVKILNFRFDSASIRRKTTTLGNMNCWVQVTIGEEILQTSKQRDTKQSPPNWSKQILIFSVPQSITEVSIVIMDDNVQVGRFKMATTKFLEKNEEQIFNQEFLYNEQVNAGSLKFLTMVGMTPTFSTPRLSVPITEHKKDDKKEQKSKKQEQTTPKKTGKNSNQWL